MTAETLSGFLGDVGTVLHPWWIGWRHRFHRPVYSGPVRPLCHRLRLCGGSVCSSPFVADLKKGESLWKRALCLLF